jgi:putative membrane protein
MKTAIMKTCVGASLLLLSGTTVLAAADLSGPGVSKLSSQDRKFALKAAQAGNAEVAAGKLAQTQGSAQQVKDFGQQMATDHGKANDELATIARSKQITLPDVTDSAHQKLANDLQKLNGPKFDKKYVATAGVKDHKEAVSLFEGEAKHGKDPELRAFAEQTLPTIRHHYDMAKTLAAGQ